MCEIEGDGVLSCGGAQETMSGVPSYEEVLGRRTWNAGDRACGRRNGGVGSHGRLDSPERLGWFQSPGMEGGPSYP